MSLKLKELQKLVTSVVKKEKNTKSLQEELVKVLGPSVLITRGLDRMAESANERLDTLELTGKSWNQINPSLLVNFISSESPEVRKLVARLLPESYLNYLINDNNLTVRAAVAKRLPHHLVLEMLQKFPNDDVLKIIEKTKRLSEDGLPNPKINDEEFDLYGKNYISKSLEKIDEPELSDSWYKSEASRLCNLHSPIETSWEENAVKIYCNGMKSSGVEVDQKKLLDAVYDCLSEKTESVLDEQFFFKNLASKLRLDEAEVMPVISETQDEVDELLSSHISNSDYIKRFEEVFDVQYTTSKNPASVLFEGLSNVNHPSTAALNSSFIRDIDEKATDKYVAAWNSKNTMKRETHCRLSWSPNFLDNTINFHLELK